MRLPSERYQYTLSTGRIFSQAAITLTIPRSITLNCCHYDTSEPVMILYYNVIDPVEGLTPPSAAEQIADSPPVLRSALLLNTIKRCRFDYAVKSMIVSHVMSILRFILSVPEI